MAGCLNGGQSAAVALADGVSSHAHSDQAACTAVAAALASLQAQQARAATAGGASGQQYPDLRGVFAATQQAVVAAAERLKATLAPDERLALDPDAFFGTTLLVAVATDRYLHLGHVGDGCVFHCHGDALEYPPVVLFSPACLNLLNPHVTYSGGRLGLTRYLGPGSARPVPTVLRLDGDLEVGDILLIGTDGFHSHDQDRRRANDGQVYVGGFGGVAACHDALRDRAGVGPIRDEAALASILADTLNNFRASGARQDDASLGLLLTCPALAHLSRAYGRAAVPGPPSPVRAREQLTSRPEEDPARSTATGRQDEAP